MAGKCWCGLAKDHDLMTDWSMEDRVKALGPMIRKTIYRNGRKASRDYEDLVQEGYHGVLLAGRTFNPERNDNFPHYAMYYVAKRVSRAHLRSRTTLKVPQLNYTQKRLKRGDETLRMALSAAGRYSVHSPITGEEWLGRRSSAPDFESIERAKSFFGREPVLACITFLRLRGFSGDRIGKLLGVSRARVSQLEARIAPALDKLRKFPKSIDEGWDPKACPTWLSGLLDELQNDSAHAGDLEGYFLPPRSS